MTQNSDQNETEVPWLYFLENGDVLGEVILSDPELTALMQEIELYSTRIQELNRVLLKKTRQIIKELNQEKQEQHRQHILKQLSKGDENEPLYD